jgi:hypothetical protein
MLLIYGQENKKILTILVLLVYDVISVHKKKYLCSLFNKNISGFSPPFSEGWWRWFGGLEDKISKIVVF